MKPPSMKARSVILTLFTSIIGIYCSPDQAGESSRSQSAVTPDDPTDFFRENSLNELFNGRNTFDEYLLYAMHSLKLTSGFDNDLHRYDTNSGLVSSFARNLSYTDDIGHLVAHIDTSELDLLKDETELTVIENELAQSRCKEQLEIILSEASRLYTDFNSFSHSKQLSLINYLDSFGSPASHVMKADFMWLGSYNQSPNRDGIARFRQANAQLD